MSKTFLAALSKKKNMTTLNQQSECFKITYHFWTWWCVLLIPALRRQTQVDLCVWHLPGLHRGFHTRDTASKKLPSNGKISIEWEYYIFLLCKFRWSSSILLKSRTECMGGGHQRHNTGEALHVHHPMRRYHLNFIYQVSRGTGKSKEQVADSLITPHCLHPWLLLRLDCC